GQWSPQSHFRFRPASAICCVGGSRFGRLPPAILRRPHLLPPDSRGSSSPMEFQPGLTVGIDLGTTFSAIAHLNEQGNPVALPNEDEEIETPSLILLADSGHVVVGPGRTRAA